MYLGYFQKYVNHAPPLLLCPPVSPRINCLFNLSAQLSIGPIASPCG